MKLDQDCIRDVLLYLEQNLQNNRPLHLNAIVETDTLRKYDRETISSALSMLLDRGYIEGKPAPTLGFGMLDFIVDNVTMSGYNYLENIK
ncbi:DUF2513 domain-containing protein [Lactobacillus sp. ESL0225]|uniref:DUF2513 domain-containing protein n=1 Tax=Lactobacillus sp. ESL0225 TaxID=2069351 RepID=UPI000EFBF448|nr:DUF2513 domain-containing protein [Lactobacillus sp. ESL0225]RMC50855.1 DUF2513 domain-containing protein [Lactobacillus sp. ESL0225]